MVAEKSCHDHNADQRHGRKTPPRPQYPRDPLVVFQKIEDQDRCRQRKGKDHILSHTPQKREKQHDGQKRHQESLIDSLVFFIQQNDPMHDSQRQHNVKKDRDIRSLEKQHVRRLICDVRRLVRIHEQHAGYDCRSHISVLRGKKTIQDRQDQNHPQHNDHEFSGQDPVLNDSQDRDQDQIGGPHKEYRAVAHSFRKQLSALHLLHGKLHIESAVRMEKSLRKHEDDPAHTDKQRDHAGKQKTFTVFSETGLLGQRSRGCHSFLFLIIRSLICCFLI